MGNKDNDRNRPRPQASGFQNEDRAKLDRILGALEHLHNMEHRILDAIAAIGGGFTAADRDALTRVLGIEKHISHVGSLILDAIGKLSGAGGDAGQLAAVTADIKAQTQTLRDAMTRDTRPDTPATGE